MTKEEVQIQMGIDRAGARFTQQVIPELEKLYSEGHTEFRLSVKSPTHCIIHPLGKDGKTFDIHWDKADF